MTTTRPTVYSVDVETKLDGTVTEVIVRSSRRVLRFDRIDSFRNWCRKRSKIKIWMICPNLELDILALFGNYYRGLGLSFDNGKIVGAWCGQIKFVDILNPKSL